MLNVDAHPDAVVSTTSREEVDRFRLRAESEASEASPVLAVPAQVSYLHAPNGRPARFRRRASRRGASVQLEAVRSAGRRFLVALTPDGVRVRVNGRAAPRVALLQVGDEIALGEEASFRLGEFRRRTFELPAPDVVGRCCGGCRTVVEADMHVFACDCGEVLHWMQPPIPDADRLECAVMASQCPSCRDELPSLDGELRWEKSS